MRPGLAAMLYMQSEIEAPGGDINYDLWLLYEFASRCRHVTEFGVRYGTSTSAFLAAQPTVLHSYDIEDCANEVALRLVRGNTEWVFHKESTLDCTIAPTEMLFIDTYHTYTQLTAELHRHHEKVARYIALHDTLSFGGVGEDGSQPGLIAAYSDFCEAHPTWRPYHVSLAQNGVTILSRRGTR